jgi:hypothetical protein
MAIPKPEPKDWALSNAQILRKTDREVLAMLRAAYVTVNAELKALVAKDSPLYSDGVRRAQLKQTIIRLQTEQVAIFKRLGDITSARRLEAAVRSERLSAADDAHLLALVGKDAEGKFLYESALHQSQRGVDAALARMGLSELPLSQRIYRTAVWMGDRLNKMINESLVSNLNAKEFAKKARDWFNPNTPGGVRYASMRLARTEINNSFHAMSAQKYDETPWITHSEWNLSKSHPKPDECNVLAAGSPYKTDETPARPHPQCMCYITPVSVDEDEFVENFLKGDYDDYLDSELEKNGWDVKESRPADPEVPPSQVERVNPAKPNANTDSALFLKANKSVDQSFSAPLRQRIGNVLRTQESIVGDRLGRIVGFRNGLPPADAKGTEAAVTKNGEIFLSSDLESRDSRLKAAEGSGWFSKCDHNHTGVDHVITHESAHGLLGTADFRALSPKQLGSIVNGMAKSFGLDLPPGGAYQQLLAITTYKSNTQKIERQLGRYAAKNYLEFTAEIWTSYSLSDHPSPAVKAMGDILRSVIVKLPKTRKR